MRLKDTRKNSNFFLSLENFSLPSLLLSIPIVPSYPSNPKYFCHHVALGEWWCDEILHQILHITGTRSISAASDYRAGFLFRSVFFFFDPLEMVMLRWFGGGVGWRWRGGLLWWWRCVAVVLSGAGGDGW